MNHAGPYQDDYGSDKIEIKLGEAGHWLRLLLRGVEFAGTSLDQLSPSDPDQQLEGFPIDDEGCLRSFRIVYEIPVVLAHRNQQTEGILTIDCTICSPEQEWEEDSFLKFTLSHDEMQTQSDWCGTGFEDELANLHEKLPEGSYINCCFNCRYSDYNPYVNSGLMGELVCFVDTDGRYVDRGKSYPGWRNQDPVFVQEFHLCSRFEPRTSV